MAKYIITLLSVAILSLAVGGYLRQEIEQKDYTLVNTAILTDCIGHKYTAIYEPVPKYKFIEDIENSGDCVKKIEDIHMARNNVHHIKENNIDVEYKQAVDEKIRKLDHDTDKIRKVIDDNLFHCEPKCSEYHCIKREAHKTISSHQTPEGVWETNYTHLFSGERVTKYYQEEQEEGVITCLEIR